jgi:hypothetical protein
LLFEVRTSPSDIQLFREEPALWLLKHHPDYLYRTAGSAATLRGHATEHGIRTACRWNMPVEGAIRHAQRLFLRNKPADLEGAQHDPYDKEFAALPDYVQQAYGALYQRGLIKRYHTFQHKCEAVIEGFKVLGYTDFMFVSEDGELLGFDLKSTARLPSEMKETHIEQQAFYEYCTGVRFSCLYATPKKSAVYTLTDDQLHIGIRRMENTLRAMRVALSLQSWEDLFTLFPPREPDGFRWDETSRYYASNIWSY